MGVSYIPVAQPGELGPGEKKTVELGGRGVVVAHLNEGYVAFSRQCPHEGADLLGAAVIGGRVRCSNHGYCYDLRTGECLLPQGEAPLAVLPVEEREEGICIKIEW